MCLAVKMIWVRHFPNVTLCLHFRIRAPMCTGCKARHIHWITAALRPAHMKVGAFVIRIPSLYDNNNEKACLRELVPKSLNVNVQEHRHHEENFKIQMLTRSPNALGQLHKEVVWNYRMQRLRFQSSPSHKTAKLNNSTDYIEKFNYA